MRYDYECPVHGEIELDHRITEDRTKQRCPVLVGKSATRHGLPVVLANSCNQSLKRLISRNLNYMSDDMRPFIGVGNGWHYKTQDKWKVDNVRPGTPDPVAVGAYHTHHRSRADLERGGYETSTRKNR